MRKIASVANFYIGRDRQSKGNLRRRQILNSGSSTDSRGRAVEGRHEYGPGSLEAAAHDRIGKHFGNI
jgi:hypothetical protein